MAPFEALYGCKCRTPTSWENLDDKITIEPRILKDMKSHLKVIKENLKEASDQYKSLANLKRTTREFLAGDKVFLRVQHGKSAIKSSKLSSRYVGPFTIL